MNLTVEKCAFGDVVSVILTGTDADKNALAVGVDITADELVGITTPQQLMALIAAKLAEVFPPPPPDKSALFSGLMGAQFTV